MLVSLLILSCALLDFLDEMRTSCFCPRFLLGDLFEFTDELLIFHFLNSAYALYFERSQNFRAKRCLFLPSRLEVDRYLWIPPPSKKFGLEEVAKKKGCNQCQRIPHAYQLLTNSP